jgi:hypothetical protein
MRSRRAFQEIAAIPMTAMMRQRLEAVADAVFIIVALVLTAIARAPFYRRLSEMAQRGRDFGPHGGCVS